MLVYTYVYRYYDSGFRVYDVSSWIEDCVIYSDYDSGFRVYDVSSWIEACVVTN